LCRQNSNFEFAETLYFGKIKNKIKFYPKNSNKNKNKVEFEFEFV